jgi:hypothetical protein
MTKRPPRCLVVEDGTAKSDADSYVSVSTASSYFADHGSPAAWSSATEAAKNAALRYAAVWLDGNWNWLGIVVAGTQSRAWPRYIGWDRWGANEDTLGFAVSYDEVPQRIQDAQCELALTHLTDALNAVTDTSGGEVKFIKLDVMELEYVDRSTSYARRMPYVSKLLKGLYTGGGWMVPVVRA